jgi:hypothetical protein
MPPPPAAAEVAMTVKSAIKLCALVIGLAGLTLLGLWLLRHGNPEKALTVLVALPAALLAVVAARAGGCRRCRRRTQPTEAGPLRR